MVEERGERRGNSKVLDRKKTDEFLGDGPFSQSAR